MTLRTDLTDGTPAAGLHSQQHNEANADILTLQTLVTGLAGGNVPTGGTTGQVLAKIDATNFNTQWVPPTAGPTGPAGAAGPAGPTGQGVPSGGSANQVLAKIDAASFNTQWINNLGGGQRPIGVGTWPEVDINPGDNWATIIAANPTGKIFVVKAGTHVRPSNTVSLGTNDNLSFLGEDGAIVDGGMISRTVTVTTTAGSATVTSSAGFLSSDNSGTTPTILWGGGGFSQNCGAIITGFASTSSITLADTATASGTFTATLVRPPASGVDHFLTGNAKNITIAGLTIQNYAVPLNRGAVHPQVLDDTTQLGLNWNVQNCVIQNNSNSGMRLCNQAYYAANIIANNGDQGIGGGGYGAEVCYNEIYGNNTFNNTVGFDAAGIKITVARGIKVHNNHVHNNTGAGIWIDVSGQGNRIEDNQVHDNTGAGVFAETTYGALIRGNDVYNNGLINTPSVYTGFSQILVSASSHVIVEYNEVGLVGAPANWNGVCVLFQDRNKGSAAPINITDGTVTSAGLTFTSTSQAQFRTSHVGSWVNGSGITPFTIFIQSVQSTTSCTLSAPPGANITAGAVTFYPPFDNLGFTGTGQSTYRHRCFDILIRRNNIHCGSNCTVAGMSTDVTEGLDMFSPSQMIRWEENNYDFPAGSSLFTWNNVFMTLTQWQTIALMDVPQMVKTPTPNTQGIWLPPTELIQMAGDPLALGEAETSINLPPFASWVQSKAYSSAGGVLNQIRPNPVNGFIFQCTTSGTTGATPPTWVNTVGSTTTDGTVVWRCLGSDPAAISGAAVIDLSLGRHLTYYLLGNVTSWTVINGPGPTAHVDYEITFVNGFVPYTLGGAIGLNIAHIDDISPRAPTALHRRTINYHWDGTVLRQRTPAVMTPSSMKGPYVAAAMTATDTTSMGTCTANGFNWQSINTQWGSLQPSLGSAIDATAGATLLTQIQNGLQAGGQTGGLLPWVDLGTSKAATWLTTNVEQFLDECGNTWNPASLHSQNVANWVWSQKGQVYLLDWINKLFAFLGQNNVTFGGVTVPAISTLAGVGVGGVLNNELHYPQGNDAGAGTATVSTFSAGTVTFTGTVPATFGTSGIARNNGTATGVVFAYTGRSGTTLTGVTVLTSDATITGGQVIAPMSFWGYGLNMQTGVNAGLSDTIANGTAGTSVQTVCPLPAYIPFVGPTQTNAKDIQWINWYLGGLQVFEAWLIKAVRAAIVANGGVCPIWVKHPNTGIRTSLPTMPSLSATLTSYMAAAAEGVDHDRMVSTYSQANNPQGAVYGPVYPDATGANLNGQGLWIGNIAESYGVKSRIMGEDAGAIDWTVQWGFASTGNTGPLSQGYWATYAAIATGVGSGNFTTLAALIAANP